MMKRLNILMVLACMAFLLVACAPQQDPVTQPAPQQPDDVTVDPVDDEMDAPLSDEEILDELEQLLLELESEDLDELESLILEDMSDDELDAELEELIAGLEEGSFVEDMALEE